MPDYRIETVDRTGGGSFTKVADVHAVDVNGARDLLQARAAKEPADRELNLFMAGETVPFATVSGCVVPGDEVTA